MTAISALKGICCFKQFITSSYSTATLLPHNSPSVLNSSLSVLTSFWVSSILFYQPQTPYLAGFGKFQETKSHRLKVQAPFWLQIHSITRSADTTKAGILQLQGSETLYNSGKETLSHMNNRPQTLFSQLKKLLYYSGSSHKHYSGFEGTYIRIYFECLVYHFVNNSNSHFPPSLNESQ